MARCLAEVVEVVPGDGTRHIFINGMQLNGVRSITHEPDPVAPNRQVTYVTFDSQRTQERRIEPASAAALRALRSYHWSRVVAARKRSDASLAKKEQLEKEGKLSHWRKNDINRSERELRVHMKAVQALNSVLNGTAEEDEPK